MINTWHTRSARAPKTNRAALERMVRGRLAEKALMQQVRRRTGRSVRRSRRRSMPPRARSSFALLPGFPSARYRRTSLRTKSSAPRTRKAKPQLVEPATYRIAQIFFAAPINDAAAVARARKQADDVAKQAQSPKADFDSLMKKYSEDPNAKQGGDTGMIPLAQLLPEMRPVVARRCTRARYRHRCNRCRASIS